MEPHSLFAIGENFGMNSRIWKEGAKSIHDGWLKWAALQRERRQKTAPRGNVRRLANGLLDVDQKGRYVKEIRENSSSPLFRLPPEIRNKIFAYAVGGNFTFEAARLFYLGDWDGESLELSRVQDVALAYAETALLPFSASIFKFGPGIEGIHEWLQCLLDVEREAITSVEYLGDYHFPSRSNRPPVWSIDHGVMERLFSHQAPMFPNLKFLHIVFTVYFTFYESNEDWTLDESSELGLNEIKKRIEAELPNVSVTVSWRAE
ncbi:uncharacterized protein EI97DRAFT_457432 [Westerdykella ornata]|uniref:Uncharacterized protein n=1 Tax=Westerdykella ornata TaxID=318751 RepID=A0A6A6JLM5_WESOR|nr:uncharacterized protein EI97DRAFT_457432 [Westerdykella ornata]KAF2277407.1 hypothetical protein EI97DRAFT_457432 [Westerdykella ornata]